MPGTPAYAHRYPTAQDIAAEDIAAEEPTETLTAPPFATQEAAPVQREKKRGGAGRKIVSGSMTVQIDWHRVSASDTECSRTGDLMRPSSNLH